MADKGKMNIGSIVQDIVTVTVPIYVYYAWRTKVPIVWTQNAAQRTVIEVIREEYGDHFSQKMKIYDLGSGLGGMCLEVARAFPNAKIIGLETAWPAWIMSWIRQRISGQNNLRFLYRNFWTYDISDGDIILCYLGDIVMPRLHDKLLKEAKSGRLFVSNTFPLPTDWLPVRRIALECFLSKEIIVYRQ